MVLSLPNLPSCVTDPTGPNCPYLQTQYRLRRRPLKTHVNNLMLCKHVCARVHIIHFTRCKHGRSHILQWTLHTTNLLERSAKNSAVSTTPVR